jgi:hypothetical protein
MSEHNHCRLFIAIAAGIRRTAGNTTERYKGSGIGRVICFERGKRVLWWRRVPSSKSRRRLRMTRNKAFSKDRRVLRVADIGSNDVFGFCTVGSHPSASPEAVRDHLQTSSSMRREGPYSFCRWFCATELLFVLTPSSLRSCCAHGNHRRRHRGSHVIARICVAAAHIFRTSISEDSLTILTVFVLSVSEVDGLAW